MCPRYFPGREDKTSDLSIILGGTWVELGHAAAFLWSPGSNATGGGEWVSTDGDSETPPPRSYKVTQTE